MKMLHNLGCSKTVIFMYSIHPKKTPIYRFPLASQSATFSLLWVCPQKLAAIYRRQGAERVAQWSERVYFKPSRLLYYSWVVSFFWLWVTINSSDLVCAHTHAFRQSAFTLCLICHGGALWQRKCSAGQGGWRLQPGGGKQRGTKSHRKTGKDGSFETNWIKKKWLNTKRGMGLLTTICCLNISFSLYRLNKLTRPPSSVRVWQGELLFLPMTLKVLSIFLTSIDSLKG